MKLLSWSILATVPFLLLACGPDKPAQTTDSASPAMQSPDEMPLPSVQAAPMTARGEAMNPQAGVTKRAGAPQALPPSDMPVPPAGANYTLQCMIFSGPLHIVEATRAKNNMIQRTGSRQWYLVHTESESTLNYGFYTTYDDRAQMAEYTRAQGDRARIASLLDESGEKLFTQVVFNPIELPDPIAPKDWDIMTSSGYWTLQVLVYRDNPQRKQAAIDMVREFRSRGVQAYYHHFPAVSEVYIGSWPKEAVKREEADAQTSNNGEQLLVFSSPVAGVDKERVTTPDGQSVKVAMPKIEVTDPSLKKAIDEYPNEYINGQAVGRPMRQPDGTSKVVPFPSCLVAIPHADTDSTDAPNSDVTTGTGTDTTGGLAPSAGEPTPGLGGIR